MTLVRVNPWRTAPAVNSLIDRFFNDTFLPAEEKTSTEPHGLWRPVVDVYDNENAIVLKADLPGMNKEDIEIDVDDRILTLKGERTYDNETKEKDFYRRERSFGTFKRVFTLPENVSAESINADFKNGVLTIEITKPEEKKPKHITVN